MEPITIEAYFENTPLFSYVVPYTWRVDVQTLMEQAFVSAQTQTNPDPFLYTLEYYGYSQSPQYPGYLGYEVESIQQYVNGTYPYVWMLYVAENAQGPFEVSNNGMDTTFPNPGAIVRWQYGPSNMREALVVPPRQQAIHERRIARASAKRPPAA
jgi:hypothetical protein